MAYSWSIGGGVITLNLDGTGSGEVSAHRTFTGLEADQRYAFYLGVNPSVVAIGAFLGVAGGDTTVADITGNQTLRARGITSGSGEITLRFGAQSIEAAPASNSSYPLDNPNQGDAEGDGFVVHPGAGSITFGSNVSGILTGYSSGIRMTQTGGGATAVMSLTLSLTPSTDYTVRVHARTLQDSAWFNSLVLRVESGDHHDDAGLGGDLGGVRPETTLDASVPTDDTGNLTVTISLPSCGFYSSYVIAGLEIEGVTGATVDFADLRYCLGSGLSETGGTGLGHGTTDDDPGEDPIPEPPSEGYPPPTTGGARAYGAFEIPPEGLGFWNSAVKQMSPMWVVSLLNAARTAGGTLWLTGRWKAWLDGNSRFSYDLWKADYDAVYNDPIANAALVAAIADGTAKANYVIDEPSLVTRWGLKIPYAVVERMCQYSKSLWPTWTTAIRVRPTDSFMARHMSGLDWLWAQYWTPLGDITAFRDKNINRAQQLNHGLVVGIDIADFLGNETRPITPDEYRQYGGILAASSFPVALMNWRYESGLYTPAFVAANQDVRDVLASYDP